jgi:hypothetical protein
VFREQFHDLSVEGRLSVAGPPGFGQQLQHRGNQTMVCRSRNVFGDQRGVQPRR